MRAACERVASVRKKSVHVFTRVCLHETTNHFVCERLRYGVVVVVVVVSVTTAVHSHTLTR